MVVRHVATDPMNRKNPRDTFGEYIGVRNNSAEYFTGTREEHSQLAKFVDWNRKENSQQLFWCIMEGCRR